MKPSDHFKNMDEVRAYVEAYKKFTTPEQYDALLLVFGLAEQEGDYEMVIIDGEEKQIDKFIAPIIKDLNRRGYHTLACCSGLQREHKNPKGHAYLSISFKDGLKKKLTSVIDDTEIGVEESECFLQQSLCLDIKAETDSIIEEKWLYLWDIFKQVE